MSTGRWSRRDVLAAGLVLPAGLCVARQASAAEAWDQVLATAAGQIVQFNAWGGDQRINDYIAWAGDEIASRHNVTLRHVKLADTTEAVARIVAEKAAGQANGGSVDLIWINGENFAALKSQKLLFGPFTERLPNFRFVDPYENPTTIVDFTVPTEGLEAPWGMAQLVFFYDTARVQTPPRAMAELRSWAEDNRGRFTYPAPPDFMGTTFLKQAFYETTADPTMALSPVNEKAEMALTPLWDFLDRLHPLLWRGGKSFPKTSADMRQLMSDGETDIYFAFNPGDASSAIAQGLLQETVLPFVPNAGSVGNTHFLAIPFNAAAKEAALVLADFLLSPEAQARKQNADIWGDPTVLSLFRLSEEDRKLFDELPRGPATPAPDELGRPLPEPHPSWVKVLEQGWARRYGA
jgi:putative thiamine transport system substrate-binding protein